MSRTKFTALALFVVGLSLGLYLFTGQKSISGLSSAAGFQLYEPVTFSKSLQQGRTMVVHVHADWCPACQQQTPVLEAMSADPAFSGVDFVRVDFDTQKAFLKENNVPVQSIILVFKDGVSTKRIVGIVDGTQIRELINEAVS